MKKLVLFALTLSFVSVGIAQISQYSPRDWYNTVKKANQVKIAEQETTFAKETNPTVSNSRAEDIVVGETWYDLQSNSTMANRIYAFEDGTIAATWTRGMDNPPNCPDRGTGYNYFDGTSWGDYPTERIENQRTGWPNIAPYGANGEITCAHSGGTDGLIFSWRENKGEGDWSYFNLPGPGSGTSQELLWPRMITTGENNEVIHVFACIGNDFVYEDLNMALVYSRSTNGGETWDPENVILEGMGSDYTSGWGGDDYAWAQPVGDTIAFIAFSGVTDGVVMKSIDGGDNWERILFYESPMPFFTGEEGTLPKCGGGDGYNAVVIDDEGLVHIAFGRQIHMDDDPAAGWSYYPYSDGLVYWNENMESLDSTKITNDILPEDWSTHYLYENGNLAAWTQPNGEDTIVGVAPYYASLTSMPQLVALRDEFGNKIVQIFYSALSVGFGCTMPSGDDANYRHIWGRFTQCDGMFSDFTDYTCDIYHYFNECVFPSVSQTMPGNKFHVLYQTDYIPGNSLQPQASPSHTACLNNMVYLPVSPLPVNINEMIGQSLEISQNFPNPFTNTSIVTVNLTQATDLSLEIFNLTGQKVYEVSNGHSNAGTHNLVINAENLSSGVYFYTVYAGNNAVTKKMIVN